MRCGIVILPEFPWAQARTYWQQAEHYGFDHAWTYDHLSWRTLADGPWHATVPTLTAAALATSTIRIGTFVASPNYRHPVPLAKELMTLDDISDGRLIAGLGAGGTGFDASVLGDPALQPGSRAARFGEFVSFLDELLTNPVTNRDGDHYSALEARMIPGCAQRPRVPFVIAANGPKGMAIAARHGAGWVTTGPPAPAEGPDLGAWWNSVASLSRRFDDVLDTHNRDRTTVDRYLSLDSSGVSSLSSLEYFRDCVGRSQDLGFTDVIIHWPRPSEPYAADPAVLEAVADDLQR